MILLACLIQASPVPAAPDIAFKAHVTAKSVRIEQKGKATLTVHADPDAGSLVNVRASPVKDEARNVTVDIDAQVRLADPTRPQH